MSQARSRMNGTGLDQKLRAPSFPPRAVGAVVISPALQRGVRSPKPTIHPESRRDGAHAPRPHRFCEKNRKTQSGGDSHNSQTPAAAFAGPTIPAPGNGRCLGPFPSRGGICAGFADNYLPLEHNVKRSERKATANNGRTAENKSSGDGRPLALGPVRNPSRHPHPPIYCETVKL
jgi:hypothetical protein